MSLLEQLNSLPMFAIVGVVILFILGLSVVFMVKSYRAGVALGMDRVKMRRAITSSVTFTLLPSISILLGCYCAEWKPRHSAALDAALGGGCTAL